MYDPNFSFNERFGSKRCGVLLSILKEYAYISEIFSSLQGEGIYLGVRQVFLRFSGCNLNCSYCDTSYARVKSNFCYVEKKPGKKDFDKLNNPLSLKEVLQRVKNLSKVLPHSISITGGEPLLQVEFLKVMLPRLKENNFKTYLETNGTLPSALRSVIKYLDIIALDFKLPSTTKDKDCSAENLKSLKIGREKDIFVKIVISSDTTVSDLRRALRGIKKVDVNIPLVLQPVTPTTKIEIPPSIDFLLYLQEISKNYLSSVRIIPQIHKIWQFDPVRKFY